MYRIENIVIEIKMSTDEFKSGSDTAEERNSKLKDVEKLCRI
jgi:hypothetical protein